MSTHLNTADLIRALRQICAISRAEYEIRLRKMPLESGPIYVIGDGPDHLVAHTAALALESFAGRPSLVRSAGEFGAYSLPAMQPRAPVLGISLEREPPSVLEVYMAAKRRGAWLMALTGDGANPLVAIADGALALPLEGEGRRPAYRVVCAHAAAGMLGLYAGLIFKSRLPQQERLLAHGQELPGHLEQLFGHSADAVRQMIDEVRHARRRLILGCGFSRPVAVQAAAWMETALGNPLHGGSPADFPSSIPDVRDETTGVIVLSGSQSPHKKVVHQLVEQMTGKKYAILAVTDGADAELIRHARLSLLIPAVPEIGGAILQLALMQWMASLAARETRSVLATPASS
jgi:DNA-binding MurR/RpiR family transcriptional regulator